MEDGTNIVVVGNLLNKTTTPYQPQITASYQLRITTSSGDVYRSSNSARVVVATAIRNFKATPTRVGAGNPTTLSWSLDGPTPTSISITPPSGAALPVSVSTTGSYSIQIDEPETGTYTLSVANANATSTANTTVTVNAVINTFSATPSSPIAGADFTLTWTATGADGYTVSLKEPNDSSFETLTGVNPNGDDVVRTAQSGTYTLRLQSGPNSITKPLVLTVQ